MKNLKKKIMLLLTGIVFTSLPLFSFFQAQATKPIEYHYPCRWIENHMVCDDHGNEAACPMWACTSYE